MGLPLETFPVPNSRCWYWTIKTLNSLGPDYLKGMGWSEVSVVKKIWIGQQNWHSATNGFMEVRNENLVSRNLVAFLNPRLSPRNSCLCCWPNNRSLPPWQPSLCLPNWNLWHLYRSSSEGLAVEPSSETAIYSVVKKSGCPHKVLPHVQAGVLWFVTGMPSNISNCTRQAYFKKAQSSLSFTRLEIKTHSICTSCLEYSLQAMTY